MDCPRCRAAMTAVFTKQGVEIDRCAACGGIWFDRGELLLFAKRPERISERLAQAVAQKRVGQSAVRSPRGAAKLAEVEYPGGVTLHLCPESGGLWVDGPDMEGLLRVEPGLRLELDLPAEAPRAAAAALLPLPNLFLRSTATLAGLYALLGAALIAAVEFLGLDLNAALIVAVIVVAVQFLLGPFFMDLSLRWLYRLTWVSPAQLPAHLRGFVERVASEQGIAFPRFGIIDDGAPQAFTYGHRPSNARIVLSRGIFELLEPEEVEAVVAHEMGHAVHWDMLLMTIAQLVPLVLYYVYRAMIQSKRSRSKGKGGQAVIAIGAYLLYIISEYAVLWFSRTREYHADRFSGQVTGRPGALAQALVKIAYGLAGEAGDGDGDKPAKARRSAAFEAVGALGIFDPAAAKALAIASYDASGQAAGGAIDQAHLKGAMRWDIWNPWAKWYELNSTHPLVAKRLQYLSNQAVAMGQAPYVTFDERKPESYWDEFLVDLLIHLLPLLALLALAATLGLFTLQGGSAAVLPLSLGGALMVLGGALLIRFYFVYRSDFFPEMSVAALLHKVKVSAVRPVPCKLRGRIIGRGVPGYILSEDFVLQDGSGIIFLDYRQPLAIWELLFGLLKAGRYQGQEVVITGWYRRAPVPYVELKSIESGDTSSKSWVPALYRFTAYFLIAAGLLLAIRPDLMTSLS